VRDALEAYHGQHTGRFSNDPVTSAGD